MKPSKTYRAETQRAQRKPKALEDRKIPPDNISNIFG
jgi:hypothetical protein